jgi:hypothetical protein
VNPRAFLQSLLGLDGRRRTRETRVYAPSGIPWLSWARLEFLSARFRDSVILLPGTAADADGAHYFPFALQRDSTGENHHPAMIGNVNPEELAARLGMLGEVLRRDIESAGSERLIDRNVDTSDPGPVQTDMRNQISALVDNGDVLRLLKLLRILFRCCNDSARSPQV